MSTGPQQTLPNDTTSNPITLALRWLFSQTSTNVMLIATQVGIAYGAFWVARDLIPQTFKSMQDHYDKIEDRHEKNVQKVIDSNEKNMQKHIEAEAQRFDDWRQLFREAQEGKAGDKNKSAALFAPMPNTTN